MIFEKGSSLVEILVSLMVFSIGMLGLAALQGVSIKLGEQTRTYTSATILVADLIDRMYANPVGFKQGNYNDSALQAAHLSQEVDCRVKLSCSPAELASYDLYIWKKRFDQAFPFNATAKLVPSSDGSDSVTISLVWTLSATHGGLEDAENEQTSSNCAMGDGRPKYERAYCTTVSFSRL